MARVPVRRRHVVGGHDLGRAHGTGQGLTGGRGLDHGHVGHAPFHQRGGGQGADGSGAEDDHPVVVLDTGLGDPVQRDGEGLGQRRGPEAQPVGQRQDLVLVGQRVAGVGPLMAGRADLFAVQADRRPSGSAGLALATAPGRPRHHRLADLPAGHGLADGGHGAGVLVALDGARGAPTLDHHVQVAAAHTAVGDLEQHVVGPDARPVDVDDLQHPLLAVDRRGHRGRQLDGRHRPTRSGRYSGWSVSHCDAARMVSSFFLLMKP